MHNQGKTNLAENIMPHRCITSGGVIFNCNFICQFWNIISQCVAATFVVHFTLTNRSQIGSEC